jgi:hypothetical protein
LVASSCWNNIAYNLIGQTSEIALSLFGPFNSWFCHFQAVLKGVSNNQQINLLLAISVAKYLSIFVLKNPMGLDSEFWCLFITLWSLLG